MLNIKYKVGDTMNEKLIYNLNDSPLSDRNGIYGGKAGSKEGILIDDEYWLVKYPKSTKSMNDLDLSYTTAPLSEYIGSHIYEILGYDVHKTFLGFRNNKIVVACKDFCEHPGDLREIRTLKNIYNQKLEDILSEELNSTGSSHTINLNELLIHLDYNPILSKIDGLKERFWDCVIIDSFIKNNDRNNGNWGLLFRNGNYQIAPIYDNGASFSNKLSDDKIEILLKDEAKALNQALNSVTCYSLDDHQLNMKKILTLENNDLKKSILRVVPLIMNEINNISSFIQNIPECYGDFLICSQIRKQFYIYGLKQRLEKILIPALNRIS